MLRRVVEVLMGILANDAVVGLVVGPNGRNRGDIRDDADHAASMGRVRIAYGIQRSVSEINQGRVVLVNDQLTSSRMLV